MMPEIIVALENIRSLYNVGAMYRTCEFFGVKKILLIGYTARNEADEGLIHHKLKKTSLGTLDLLETERFATMEDVKEAYTTTSIISIEQSTKSKNLYTWTPKPSKFIIVFGNEVSGIKESTLDISSEIIEIPRTGTHHSLNVATTCGIILSYLQLGTLTKP